MAEAPRTRDTVLVVDDSPDTLRFLTDALEDAGSTVLVATGGHQALEVVVRMTPDIILMDAMMPGIDGFETCRRLKGISALAHVPVVFMTGLSETEHIVRGLEAGGVDYVTKPIVLEELFARIRVHLANARSAQSARAALDSAGRYLLAASRIGEVLWSTPQASRLLSAVLEREADTSLLPDSLRDWLNDGAVPSSPEATQARLTSPDGQGLILAFIGQSGDDEFLFRLTVEDAASPEEKLRRHFSVTAREAEVLLWVAHGKSNRDIGDILGLSPRTVNKHLEQIYSKLGIENRASAAAMAMGVLTRE
ncbi:Stalked cell differentiation-controlling protein [Hartmannibacter diazotrophicus]|uniref:Stalked cell differentiation-controlling protein n=1 Tax=Hartmannibacter diazotrophicus TaxID=1482074 RepID=A0A2C9D1Y6_9HYPH|nr:response regulator transcription factor [Hartmannibacter diazotrophicus]SON54179.1 Stalked cell differentiation-controlling protein [Hartmannibacter diazotrophicus]